MMHTLPGVRMFSCFDGEERNVHYPWEEYDIYCHLAIAPDLNVPQDCIW